MRRRGEKVIKLDRQIIVQNYFAVKNSFGEELISYYNLSIVRARIEYKEKNTDEKEYSSRETGTQTIIFKVRYNANFSDRKQRILYNCKAYDIVSIQEDGRRHYLFIEGQEKGIDNRIGGVIPFPKGVFDNDTKAYEAGVKYNEYYLLSDTNDYGETPNTVRQQITEGANDISIITDDLCSGTDLMLGIYDNDGHAAENGVQLGFPYQLSTVNSYGGRPLDIRFRKH